MSQYIGPKQGVYSAFKHNASYNYLILLYSYYVALIHYSYYYLRYLLDSYIKLLYNKSIGSKEEDEQNRNILFNKKA